jgi:hypothetical protein
MDDLLREVVRQIFSERNVVSRLDLLLPTQ